MNLGISIFGAQFGKLLNNTIHNPVLFQGRVIYFYSCFNVEYIPSKNHIYILITKYKVIENGEEKVNIFFCFS